MAAQSDPAEYLTIKDHIADINDRLTGEANVSQFADELLQADLINVPAHENAIAVNGVAPYNKISALTSVAMAKIRTSPALFNALVAIIEERDTKFASELRRECLCESIMYIYIIQLLL